MEADLIALTVLSPRGRRDVVVRPDVRVGQLSDALDAGNARSATPLRTVTGDPLARDARLGSVVHSGDTLVTAPDEPAAGAPRGRPGRRPGGRPGGARPGGRGARAGAGVGPFGRRTGTSGASGLSGVLAAPTVPLAWAGVGLLVLAVAARLLDLAAPGGPRPWLAGGAGALALAIALLPVQRGPAADPVAAACWLAGTLAGASVVGPDTGAGLMLPVTVGLLAGTVASALRVIRAGGGGDALARVLLAVGGVGALGGVVAVLLERPYPAALLLGFVPLALRAAPAVSLDVPDPVLLDPEPAQRTALGVRERIDPAPASVRARTVNAVVSDAVHRRAVTVVVLALAAALLATVAAVLLPAGTLERITTATLTFAVALALALVPRRDRDAVTRWAPRAAALLVLAVAVAVALVCGVSPVALAVAALVAAAIAVGVAAASARDWRSLRASRLADAVESLAVVLSPALGVVAVGTVGLLMELPS